MMICIYIYMFGSIFASVRIMVTSGGITPEPTFGGIPAKWPYVRNFNVGEVYCKNHVHPGIAICRVDHIFLNVFDVVVSFFPLITATLLAIALPLFRFSV